MASEKIWKDVFFYSDGLKIAAHLYVPADWKPGDPPRPAVVSLAGYTGMKDIYGMDVPRRLWEEGYFVLATDYRGFGASEGERGRHRPLEQAQDTHDALTYLETVEGVDPERLAIYGTSFGGAHAIWVAAFDERVRVVVSSVMASDIGRWMRTSRRPSEFVAFKRRFREAGRKRVTTGQDERIAVTDLILPDPHTMDVFRRFHQKDATYVDTFDMASVDAAYRYKPEWVAGRISPRPALIIWAENDELCTDEALRCYEQLGEPKKLVVLPKAQHYDSYYFVNPEMHALGMGATLEWFKTYL